MRSSATANVDIRAAREDDLPALARIYDHYVVHTAITFDLQPFGAEGRRAWFGAFAARGPHRLLVADRGGQPLGYACSHRFRPRGAYDTSVETSIYLDHEATGKGLGKRLYGALFAALEGEDVHRAYAGMTLPNEASLVLHQRFGFKRIGIFREVGRKFGRYWDVEWLEKALR